MNALGQEIAQPLSGHATAGTHRVQFNASGFSAGVYFYDLETAAGAVTRSTHFIK